MVRKTFKLNCYLPKSLKVLVLASVVCLPIPSLADEVLATEKKLLQGLQSLQSLSMDQALTDFSELSEAHPNYKLVQLLKADLLALKSGQKPLLDDIHKSNPRTVGRLTDEADVRWQFSKSSLEDDIGFNNYVLKSAKQSHIVVVSLAESRLYLYQRNGLGQMQQVADYYVSMGRLGAGKEKEGDSRTPIGVYHVVDLLADEELPDLYGVGALPLNYPNKWDSEKGRTGSGIWLHGTPSDTYTRAPKASRGCVVLTNNAMQKLLLEYQLPYATPIVILEDTDLFLKQSEQKEVVLKEVKAWLSDNYVSVQWESVSVYRYPNEDSLLYITFPAEAEGALVHQYWQRGDDGSWKLVFESEEPVQIKTNIYS